MSYIRSTSNPEGLYIIGNMQGQIEIYHDGGNVLIIPRHVFHHVALGWDEGYDFNVTYRGLTVEEKQNKKGDFKIFLTYETTVIEMWVVTWEYIVNDIKRRDNLK